MSRSFAEDEGAPADPRELIRNGNVHYADGRFPQALESYDKVKIDEEQSDELLLPDLLHNRAAAHFKLGQLDEARELWVRSASLSDAGFEAAARYNLGNCDYADALRSLRPAGDQQPAQVDAKATMALLERAIANYRDALRLIPDLANARANLELAAQLKKRLEDMSEQQPQSQPSSRPSDQQQDQDQQQQDQQQSEDQQKQDQQDQQQDESQQEQEGQDQQEQQSDDAQDADQQEQQPEASEEQQQEQEASEAEQQPAQPMKLTKEEAERLLQMIRDAEKQRRARLRARQAARQKPVDKDW